MSQAHLCFHLLPVLLSLSLHPTSAVLCHQEDKEVLLRIKSSFPNFLNVWNPDSDCCYWFGVKCHFKTHRVISLNFFKQRDMIGQIPSAIGNLTCLQNLDLHHNPNVTGPIPFSLGNLKHLTFLRLDFLSLTGNIPSSLGQLKNLTYLNLSYNKLTGSIPDSLSQIPGLGYIRLDRNQLTGTIPASIANLKGNDPYLLLSHNQLSGKIPASFADVSFETLDLSRNRLEGDASPLFGSSKTTPYIDISRNMFEFNLSKLQVTNSSLTYLFMDHNKVYGNIPAAFTNLELRLLNVSYNRLCGKIPVGGSLQTFDYSVYFHNRCLCGAPLDICK